jgi:hypothetical protein
MRFSVAHGAGTATALSRPPGSLARWTASTAITEPWAKLDHAAIRLDLPMDDVLHQQEKAKREMRLSIMSSPLIESFIFHKDIVSG